MFFQAIWNNLFCFSFWIISAEEDKAAEDDVITRTTCNIINISHDQKHPVRRKTGKIFATFFNSIPYMRITVEIVIKWHNLNNNNSNDINR